MPRTQSSSTMSKPEFTHENAYKIQQEHLERWKRLLKPEIFAKVEAKVKSLPRPDDPFEVMRGDQLTCLVLNLRHED